MVRGIGPGLLAGLIASAASVGATPADLPLDEAAERALLAEAGEGSALQRTPHFLIGSNADADTTDRFVRRLEGTYRAVDEFLRQGDPARERPRRRAEVIFFRSCRDFQRYAARLGHDVSGSSGFYNPADGRAVFFDAAGDPRLRETAEQIEQLEKKLGRSTPDEPARSSDASDEQRREQLRELRRRHDAWIERINQVVIQHEIAHQLFFSVGVHVRGAANPPWLMEGLACLFETPRPSGGGKPVATNAGRLRDLRKAIGGDESGEGLDASAFEAAAHRQQVVRLRQLVADSALFEPTAANLNTSYAEAWALVYYLQRQQRAGLDRYMALVAKRQPGQSSTATEELATFEAAFGPLDEAFERKWATAILQLSVPPALETPG